MKYYFTLFSVILIDIHICKIILNSYKRLKILKFPYALGQNLQMSSMIWIIIR